MDPVPLKETRKKNPARFCVDGGRRTGGGFGVFLRSEPLRVDRLQRLILG
jgi:hypothetical protein